TPDDRKLLRSLATPGLLDLLERGLPPYADGGDEGLEADRLRVQYAIRLWQMKRPSFMTVYLASLDHVEHQFGPLTPQANATLERSDELVGALRAAAGPEGVLAVVSDHGFLPVDREVNLLVKFRGSGLADAESATGSKWWNALSWPAGASAAVIVRAGAPDG